MRPGWAGGCLYQPSNDLRCVCAMFRADLRAILLFGFDEKEEKIKIARRWVVQPNVRRWVR